MHPVYRRRRDALPAALARRLPEIRPVGVCAGLHVAAWLPDGLTESRVVSATAGRGLRAEGIGGYRLGNPGPEGLILGCATLGEQTLAACVDILAAAIAEL